MFQDLDQARHFVDENGIQAVDLKYCDLWGRWHQLTIPVSKFVSDLMVRGIGIDGSSVGTTLIRSYLLKEYKSLLEKAGLPKIRFHDLRHTAASIMLNHGVPPYVVSRKLGHSKPNTTMGIYGHLIPVMHSEIGNRIDE